ncbi:putative nonaspanin (TM9SF) [Helianthus anomalus]
MTDQGDIMEVKTRKLASTKTNVANSYYSVPYCRPYKIVETAQNLGDILSGGGIQNTLYEVIVLPL